MRASTRKTEKVVIYGIKDSSKNITKTVRKMLHKLKIFVESDESILIKPSWVCARKGATTDLRLIEAVTEFLTDKGVKVIIGEGSGYEFDTNKVFEILNVRYFSDKYGVPVINLREEKTRKVNIEGLVLKEINLPEIVLKVNGIVNLPKLKSHVLTDISFAMKNLIGLIPNDERRKAHVFGLNQAILDLDKYLQDKNLLTIVDGIEIMSGRGPAFGDIVRANILVGGKNNAAIDKIICDISGINYKSIKQLRLAEDQGLLPSKIDVIRDKYQRFSLPLPTVSRYYRVGYWLLYVLDYLVHPFLRKSLIPEVVTKFGTSLEISKRCNECGECVKVCPVNAISADYTIDFERCRYVRCFRCHDVCPLRAIEVKGYSRPVSSGADAQDLGC